MSVTPASGERVHALLTDGTTVCVRPARPDDQKALRLHSEMSDASLRLRFFSVSRRSGEQAAARVAQPEDSGYRALVAERGGRIIRIAEYQIDVGKTAGSAEISLAVGNKRHHRGVGTLLLEHLISAARAHGVRTFTAGALTDNHEVLKVFADLGLRAERRFDGPAVHCVIPLGGTGPVVLPGLEQLLLRLSRMASDLPQLAEVDFNPVLARPRARHRSRRADPAAAAPRPRPLSAPAPLNRGPAHRRRRRNTMKHSKVGALMTADVVRAEYGTPFKEVARRLAEHRISGLPVVDDDEKVLGVISETDVMARQAETRDPSEPRRLLRRLRWTPGSRARRAKARARTAGQLMSRPAITVHSDATVVEAARVMAQHRVERLPVVDDEERLVGIVTRRDLLEVFLRPDAEIREAIRNEVLGRALWLPPDAVNVDVREGVVTLTGQLERRVETTSAVEMCRRMDGVVAVVNHLTYRFDDSGLSPEEPTLHGLPYYWQRKP
ncbi:hypothetical protein [Streptomyces afghaniensis 772] [Streptomyces afghaniensis]